MGHDHLSFVLSVQTMAMGLDFRHGTEVAHQIVAKACSLDEDDLFAGLETTDGDHGQMAKEFVRWQYENHHKPEWITRTED